MRSGTTVDGRGRDEHEDAGRCIDSSFASRITLAVAAIGALLSLTELALIYALVGVELQQTEGFAVDAGIIVAGLVAHARGLRDHHQRHGSKVRRAAERGRRFDQGGMRGRDRPQGRDRRPRTRSATLASSYNQMLDLIVYLIRQTQESSRAPRRSRRNDILVRHRAAGLRLRRAGRLDQPRRRRRWRSSRAPTARSPRTPTRS